MAPKMRSSRTSGHPDLDAGALPVEVGQPEQGERGLTVVLWRLFGPQAADARLGQGGRERL